jgi:hypothetical protein
MMPGSPGMLIEIDGQRPTAEQLREAVVSHYGHFTAMQVRHGPVRGLDLHLARLDAANREMFGIPLDPVRVGSYSAAFVTNSRGIAGVGQIDDTAVPVDPDLMKALARAYESAPWDAI